MEKKLLFLDLDGTLLDDEKHISPGNRQALEELYARGHGVVITTGRPLPSAIQQAHLLGLDRPGGYLIAYNGSLIYDWTRKEAIFSRAITRADAAEIFALANQAGVHIQTYDDQRVLVEARCEDEALARYCWGTQMEYQVIRDIRSDLREDPIKCLAIDFAQQEPLRALEAQIRAQLPGRLDCFFSCDAYLEIVPQGISKGQALRMLCRLADVPLSHSVAVGDAANDIPMIEAAGVGVAMCNGTAEAKAAADVVTQRDNNHDGVAEVIQTYFL